MKKYEYIIFQGFINQMGNGNIYPIHNEITLSNAKMIFNKIKNDFTGWVNKSKNGCLITYIERVAEEGNNKIINYHEKCFK